MIRLQKDIAGWILACTPAYIRLFNAVIHRIADQMGQWVSDSFDDGLIQFNVFAFQGQFDLFAQVLRQIADYPGEFIEDIANGLHAGQHDGFLQFGSDQVDPLACDLRTALIP